MPPGAFRQKGAGLDMVAFDSSSAPVTVDLAAGTLAVGGSLIVAGVIARRFAEVLTGEASRELRRKLGFAG